MDEVGKTALEETHKVQPWMRPQEIELRTNAKNYLQKAIELGILPDNRVKQIKAFAEGESSAAFKVDTESSPFVVKMTAEVGGVETEAHFLKAWEKEGVKVPQVLKVVPVSEEIPTSVMVMEFVNAPLLGDAYTTQELVDKGIARKLGRTLAIMHRAKGKGFGFPVGDDRTKGIYQTFREEVEDSFGGKRINWVKEQGAINEKDVEAIAKATQILEDDIKNGTKPSLTHNDFRPYNMFATDPVTIFDPDSRITHPAICLSFALLKPLIDKTPNPKEREEMLAGYREITPVDDQTLAAATVLRGTRKLHTWLRKGRQSDAEMVRNIVRENQKLLG